MKLKLLIFLCTILVLKCFSQDTISKVDSLEQNFKFKEVLTLREQALKVRKNVTQDSLQKLQVLRDIAQYQNDISNPELRVNAYKNLIISIEKLDDLGYSSDYLYQAYRRLYIFSHNYMRNMEATQKYIDKSIQKHFERSKIDSITLLKTLHSLGVISRELNKYETALKTFANAEEFYFSMKQKDTNTLGSIYSDWANVYHANFLNIPPQRIKLLKKALKIFESVDKPNLDYQTSLYTRLADFEKEQGNYQKALGYLNKGLQLYLKEKEAVQSVRMGKLGVKKELQYHHFLLEIYSKTNDEAKMLDQLEKMESIKAASKLDAIEADFISIAYLFLSRYYLDKSTLKAQEFIDKGIKLNNSIGEEDVISDLLIEQSKLYRKEKQFIKSKEVIKRLKKRTNKTVYIDQLITKENIFIALAQNNLEQQKSSLEKALMTISIDSLLFSPSKNINDTGFLLEVINAIDNHKDLQNIKQKYIVAAKQQFETNVKQEALNYKLKTYYDGIIYHYLDQITKGNFNNEQLIEIDEFLETTKNAFIFNDFVVSRLKASAKEVDSLVVKGQILRSQISKLKQDLVVGKTDSIKQLLFEKELSYTKIDNQLKNKYSGYQTLTKTSNYKEVLKKLASKQVIKFIEANNTLYRVTYNNNKPNVTSLGNYKTIASKVKSFVKAVKFAKTSIENLQEQGAELYEILFKNIELKNNELLIVPEGVLNYLPFELLRFNDKYLVENNAISYTSSLALHFAGKPNKNREVKNDIVLFAPSYQRYKPTNQELAVRNEPYYLEGTLDEVNDISKLFDSKVYIEKEASLKNFMNISKDYKVMHFSMHAYLHDSDPELSSLVFTDETTNNNQLFISDLYALNFNSDLAVLSACNTGVGQQIDGKGLVTLSNAFICSGVPSVLSSLWSAPDYATKSIMVSFYKYLKTGVSKSRALQMAKLDYLKSTDDPELLKPYLWSGFVIHGDDSALSFKASTNYTWILLGVLLLVALLFVIKKLFL